MVSRRSVLKALVVLGGLTALGYVYPRYIETNILTVTKLNLDLGLGIRAVHISDTHFASSAYNPDSVVNLIKDLKPDVIFHTGDLITYLNGLETGLDFISKLSEIADVFIVAGNHDHWSGLGSDGLKNRFERIGNVYVLNNEAMEYHGLWVIGVDDPYTYQDDLSKALKHVSNNGRRILLAHSPQIIDKAVNRVDLILSGHTHGGQIRIPFMDPIWLPLPSKYRKYDYGLFEVEDTLMFVSRGIGTTFLPIRFNCPPEVVSINL
ncbi:hypothetical protein DRN84_01040 [Candidatus Geothermarchaeota archaeon]|nr:MAG: hypothetical protein DRN84_01040 [Candidatus Geothermarchaeota archaeon]